MMESIRGFEQSMVASINGDGGLPSAAGAFINSCYGHCKAMEDGYWNTVEINGVSMQQAITNWWGGLGHTSLYAQHATNTSAAVPPATVGAPSNWHWPCNWTTAGSAPGCNPTCPQEPPQRGMGLNWTWQPKLK